jgi:hypothetical protein
MMPSRRCGAIARCCLANLTGSSPTMPSPTNPCVHIRLHVCVRVRDRVARVQTLATLRTLLASDCDVKLLVVDSSALDDVLAGERGTGRRDIGCDVRASHVVW